MTVVGATTAELAPTAYVPPFKYVTSSAATPLVTGTVTGGSDPERLYCDRSTLTDVQAVTRQR